jgi:polygalacturonase
LEEVAMPIPRRDFIRSGLAVAALAATGSGCEKLTIESHQQPSGGWDQVPGILARIVPPQFAAQDFVVTDYGAAGTGKVDCYPAFAAAIKACNQAGGGRVVVPAAHEPYLINGPIHLLSNVNLYLEQGSRIQFGTNPTYYLPVVLVRYQGIRCYNYSPLIYAYQQTNIAITGSGIIDGRAYDWGSWENLSAPDWAKLLNMVTDGVPVDQRIFGSGHHLRLTMFEPYECQNVLVQGVTLKASPFWTMHPTFCTNVTIQDVTVQTGTSNDDGCDPDSCTDVLIDGCTFTTADDSISIKAGYEADAVGLPPCENIVIQNCTSVKTNWGAFTIGSNTTGTIQSVFIQNCVALDCQNAYFIKSNSAIGGKVQNVFIRSSKASKCEQFFYLQTNYNFASGSAPPLFFNINLENMSCDNAGGIAFLLGGDARNPIEFVTLADIAVGSAGSAQQVKSVLFLTASNVTVAGQQITLTGLL